MSHGHSLQLDFQMRASSADSIRASRFFGLHNRPDIRLLLPTRQHGYLLSSGRRPYKSFPRLTSQALDRNHPSPYPARSASSNKCRTNPGGCRFPGGLRQISWRRFSSPGMGRATSAPLRTSSCTAEAITNDTPSPALTACLTASVLPSCIPLRGTPSSPKYSVRSRPVPLPGSPPSIGRSTRRSRSMHPASASAWSGLTISTSGSTRQRRCSKSGEVATIP